MRRRYAIVIDSDKEDGIFQDSASLLRLTGLDSQAELTKRFALLRPDKPIKVETIVYWAEKDENGYHLILLGQKIGRLFFPSQPCPPFYLWQSLRIGDRGRQHPDAIIVPDPRTSAFWDDAITVKTASQWWREVVDPTLRPVGKMNVEAVVRLMLLQAITDLSRPEHAEDARRWINGDDAAIPFDVVCHQMGLDPASVRRALLDRKAALSIYQRLRRDITVDSALRRKHGET